MDAPVILVDSSVMVAWMDAAHQHHRECRVVPCAWAMGLVPSQTIRPRSQSDLRSGAPPGSTRFLHSSRSPKQEHIIDSCGE